MPDTAQTAYETAPGYLSGSNNRVQISESAGDDFLFRYDTESDFPDTSVMSGKEPDYTAEGEAAAAVLADMPHYAEKMHMPSADEVDPQYFYECLLTYSAALNTEEKEEVFSAVREQMNSVRTPAV